MSETELDKKWNELMATFKRSKIPDHTQGILELLKILKQEMQERKKKKEMNNPKCPCGDRTKEIYEGHIENELPPIYICVNCGKIYTLDTWKWG